jgi:putative selenate reductase
MSGRFHPISLKLLLQLILNEFDAGRTIFGIPEELFFKPGHNLHLSTELFNQKLHSPLGVAAGPHTQMAQNIVAGWLMGASYIELKTVQTLDEIEVSKPCIDMQDEGYNCEWSQELKIKESFNEYLNAWIIIHILNHKLRNAENIGTVFNMSVGYNMQGIINDNVQWFLGKMKYCAEELKSKINEIRKIYPGIDSIDIPVTISNNITLSTMHGCPAGEIEEIAGYLINKCNLYTYIKINPTLLGPGLLKEILNRKLKFKTVVPDFAFDHDLKYPDAVKIIKSLQTKARKNNLQVGLKLTNTLESLNNRNVFGKDVEMMYMSGRALHPISINLAKKLQQDFNGELLLSFSAGADAFNISEVISCGFKTVTVCSDILKPGGYMRLYQYFENLHESFSTRHSDNIREFIINSSDIDNPKDAALANLIRYAGKVLESPLYKRDYIKSHDIKTDRDLKYFDCISAPCRDTCATNQDIPDYLYYTATNQPQKAYQTILRTNPFPSVTGMVCDHLCQNKCTRINYDEPVKIREVKRFISEQEDVKLRPNERNNKKAAIIGAGPSGLSCAYYLALAGFTVDVFEARSKAGGMVRFAIPGFRLTDEAIEKDINRITETGVTIHYNSKIDYQKFQILKKDFDFVFIGAGAQRSAAFNIEGADAKGIIDPLEFLFNVKSGKNHGIGRNVVIIGGGNTAMDTARTAWRIVGNDGKVTILYRRTINEMPADNGEIKAVVDEGVQIIELAFPEKVIIDNGHVKALLCSKMELKDVDNKGRPAPVKIEGSEFEIFCDTVIPAIGQITDIDFEDTAWLAADNQTFKTKSDNVLIGGDALRGASTAINAIADGRKAAEQIIMQSGICFNISKSDNRRCLSKNELMIRRSKRIFGVKSKEADVKDRRNFSLVSETIDKPDIIEEAARCLYCDEICDICTIVCPNFANYSYEVIPVKYMLQKAFINANNRIEFQDDQIFEVNQKYQILNISNFCNNCGNCGTFCPTGSAPYMEKPKFFLTFSSFKEAEAGYYMAKGIDRINLISRLHGITETFSELSKEYLFESDLVFARINKDDFKLLEVKFKTPFVKQVHFEHAAQMSILIKGAVNLVFE